MPTENGVCGCRLSLRDCDGGTGFASSRSAQTKPVAGGAVGALRAAQRSLRMRAKPKPARTRLTSASVPGSGSSLGSPYRKSSITTRSTVGLSEGPSAVVPVMILTFVIRPSAGPRVTPRKENVWLPTKVSTGKGPIAPIVVAKAIEVPAKSTSENTTPNPLTPAGKAPPVPGIEKNPSVTLLPIGVNRRFRLKGAKSVAYCGLIKLRLRRPPEAAAWVSPVPGVVNVAPRVFWKTVNGVTGAVPSITGGPPPSQFISRRPVGSGPGLLPLFGSPKAARKSFTVSVIEATFGPESEKIVTALAGVCSNRETAKNAPRFRIIDFIPYLSFGRLALSLPFHPGPCSGLGFIRMSSLLVHRR